MGAGSCNGHFPCCRGMRCEAILGGRGRRCVKFHPVQRCSALWEKCSVFGIFAPKCCNRFQCVRHGILDWKCEPKCVDVGRTCGGPGQTCGNHFVVSACPLICVF